jgi:hypothetical protein
MADKEPTTVPGYWKWIAVTAVSAMLAGLPNYVSLGSMRQAIKTNTENVDKLENISQQQMHLLHKMELTQERISVLVEKHQSNHRIHGGN